MFDLMIISAAVVFGLSFFLPKSIEYKREPPPPEPSVTPPPEIPTPEPSATPPPDIEQPTPEPSATPPPAIEQPTPEIPTPEPSATPPPDIDQPTPEISTPPTDVSSDCEPLLVNNTAASTRDSTSKDDIVTDFETSNSVSLAQDRSGFDDSYVTRV